MFLFAGRFFAPKKAEKNFFKKIQKKCLTGLGSFALMGGLFNFEAGVVRFEVEEGRVL